MAPPATLVNVKLVGAADNEAGAAVIVSVTGMLCELGVAPGAETVIEAL